MRCTNLPDALKTVILRFLPAGGLPADTPFLGLQHPSGQILIVANQFPPSEELTSKTFVNYHDTDDLLHNLLRGRPALLPYTILPPVVQQQLDLLVA